MSLRPGSRAGVRAATAAAAGARPWSRWLLDFDVAYRARRAFERELEQRRLFPWSAVAFALGIIGWFAADGTPSLVAPAVAVAAFGAAAITLRDRLAWRVAMTALALAAAGFAAAGLRGAAVQAPRLTRVTVAEVAGWLESVDKRRDGARMVLWVTDMSGVAEPARPQRVRLVVRGRVDFAAGSAVSLRARLMPPPEPALVGGYDFARDAYFRGIGAVGSVTGAITARATGPPAPIGLRLAALVDRARNDLTDRIAGIVGGEAGALAAALVTGKRDLIGAETNDALRAAGLYHIVSISGLHMVLAAGVFFWSLRALLAAVPGLALAWPIKKLAAVGAMIGAVAYCVFTGSEVATERSLIMVLVMLAAILVDRPALSMRNLAFSALLVLAREPESLLGPSFQMSYAAVAGLVAAAEWSRDRPAPDTLVSQVAWVRLAGHLWRASAAVLVTTIIASIATAPFAAYHFQRLNPFGIIGNALALPFVSFVVMPAAVAGAIAHPFGLDGPIWWLMGQGTRPVLVVSDGVAALSGSVTGIVAFGAGALALASAAIVWFCLWRTWLRYMAAAPAILALALAAQAERADIVVARDGAGIGFRGPDGKLAIAGRVSRFDAALWLQADGDTRAARALVAGRGADCDARGCVARPAPDVTVALVTDPIAFATDCKRATVVVSPLTAPADCRPRLLLDRTVLRDRGAAIIRFRQGNPDLSTVRDQGRRRPWQPERPPWLVEAEATPPAPATTPRRGTETVDPRADTPLDPPEE